ncbi:hypothetical protein DUNSADRAFT_10071 [Dunaliella salina]|uniref:Encoded protein n=1 Tax=Dunaliella salina TaxID=3046 RepID=A0ABQ7GG52_DUNSA|nr:hypothetical protein DUNSADRAFT_10071 [Dunaliella salina]|eukprot:KAF5833580.1 hypothetical protein DUNSADRAFT_10071 [Dunaliella salina]
MRQGSGKSSRRMQVRALRPPVATDWALICEPCLSIPTGGVSLPLPFACLPTGGVSQPRLPLPSSLSSVPRASPTGQQHGTGRRKGKERERARC